MEIWKDIPGYEGRYQASTKGNVRSLDSEIVKQNRWGGLTTFKHKGRILLPWINKKGYSYHQLGANCKKETHYWIALTFLGERPFVKAEVNHIDLNKQNNAIENLEWVTRAGNRQHAVFHGAHNKNVLSPDEVKLIRTLKKQGVRTMMLEKQFNVGRHTISNIVSGKTWGWL